MHDPNLGLYPLSHQAVVWLWAHPSAWWSVAGFLAGWRLRGRLVAYSLGLGRGKA